MKHYIFLGLKTPFWDKSKNFQLRAPTFTDLSFDIFSLWQQVEQHEHNQQNIWLVIDFKSQQTYIHKARAVRYNDIYRLTIEKHLLFYIMF